MVAVQLQTLLPKIEMGLGNLVSQLLLAQKLPWPPNGYRMPGSTLEPFRCCSNLPGMSGAYRSAGSIRTAVTSAPKCHCSHPHLPRMLYAQPAGVTEHLAGATLGCCNCSCPNVPWRNSNASHPVVYRFPEIRN